MCSCIGNVYVLDPKKLCLGNVANVYVLANVSVVEAKKCIENVYVLETKKLSICVGNVAVMYRKRRSCVCLRK